MDRFAQLFEKQKLQTEKFFEIQRKNGLWESVALPVSMETHEGTLQLHTSLHWIALELSETLFASQDDRPEELADVLHFILEFCILAGLTPDQCVPWKNDEGEKDRLDYLLEASQHDMFVFPDLDSNLRFAIIASLRVADLLKNKPWKQTIKPMTSVAQALFLENVRGLWYWYGACARTAGLTGADLFNAYEAKEQINYDRVRTGV